MEIQANLLLPMQLLGKLIICVGHALWAQYLWVAWHHVGILKERVYHSRIRVHVLSHLIARQRSLRIELGRRVLLLLS